MSGRVESQPGHWQQKARELFGFGFLFLSILQKKTKKKLRNHTTCWVTPQPNRKKKLAHDDHFKFFIEIMVKGSPKSKKKWGRRSETGWLRRNPTRRGGTTEDFSMENGLNPHEVYVVFSLTHDIRPQLACHILMLFKWYERSIQSVRLLLGWRRGRR